MLKQILTTGIAALGLMLTMQASAHQSHNGHGHDKNRYHKPTKPVFSVNRAQSIQATLINNGVKNRSLTRYEETKLRNDQRSIAHLEHQYRRNGLQKWELNALEKRLKSASKRIKSYMNNHEYRPVRHHKKPRHYKHSRHHGQSSHKNSSNGSFTVWISK